MTFRWQRGRFSASASRRGVRGGYRMGCAPALLIAAAFTAATRAAAGDGTATTAPSPDIVPWLPTIGAVGAAVVAGIYAWRANQANIANQRVIELEKRLAVSRLDTYKPLMEAIGAYFAKGEPSAQEEKRRNERLITALTGAALWVPVYGSDETVRMFHRMMQVAYSGAPAAIMLRTYGQFMLAIRRDLGDRTTSVDVIDLLGIRINDIYAGGMAADLRLSDAEFYTKHKWTPPWTNGPGAPPPGEG